MSSIVAKNSVATLFTLLATATLAFSSGCALDEDSVDLDDEEVATSEMAISGSFSVDAAKSSCEAKKKVWKDNACLNKCVSGYKFYVDGCYTSFAVDQWVKEDAFQKHCEGALHGKFHPGPFGKCLSELPCTPPPGNTAGWACQKPGIGGTSGGTVGGGNPWFNNGQGNTDGLEIPWCVGLGCGTETNTGNSTDWNPDDNCYDPAHCFG